MVGDLVWQAAHWLSSDITCTGDGLEQKLFELPNIRVEGEWHSESAWAILWWKKAVGVVWAKAKTSTEHLAMPLHKSPNQALARTEEVGPTYSLLTETKQVIKNSSKKNVSEDLIKTNLKAMVRGT